MINEIIDAICISLYNTFGEGKTIYTKLKNQDFEEPCFTVKCLTPQSNRFLGNRYYRDTIFRVQYYPLDEIECNGVIEKLFVALEYVVTVYDTFAGAKMHGEMVDGVLNFFVNYNTFAYKTKDGVKMGAYKQPEVKVKG